jgi:ubiquinone biosynthesis protein COQ4
MSTLSSSRLVDVDFAKRFADRLASRFASGFERGVRRRSVRDALAALWNLLRDPNDTAQGFRLLEALDPYIYHRELELMRRAPNGTALLRERPALLPVLCDRAALAAMPPGSLGHAYREYCEREGLAPEAFVQIGEAGSVLEDSQDELVRYAAERARDSHDLWHVVFGCRTDLIGEAGILGFTLAQTHSPGMLLLFVGGLLHSFSLRWKHGVEMRRLGFMGLRSGFRAEPLAAVPWESWLQRPLDEVRAELGITETASYTPVYHSSARS